MPSDEHRPTFVRRRNGNGTNGQTDGSRHPRHGFVYPLNYGFVFGPLAADGSEIDAYVLGILKPQEEFTGVCRAVIVREDDDDPKLAVMPSDKEYSDEQIRALTELQEQFFQLNIVRHKLP